MKKILIALLLGGFTATLCLAQVPMAAENKASAPIVDQNKKSLTAFKIIKGKVESVIVSDPAKGIKSSLAVITDNGSVQSFIVPATAAIYDTDWKAASLEKVNKGANVKVKYSVSKEGANEALSINLMK
jgi:hypothetical protein